MTKRPSLIYKETQKHDSSLPIYLIQSSKSTNTSTSSFLRAIQSRVHRSS